ncbi:DUF2270 domain-containing protein [Halococcoides cellulosivorans]|uniref:DUF2270 domain-containing protein n=1 Tax=Halococcoides cellulosivorans TaxID=1679096 RepID=A0A2R4WZ67_9EURY|nr:DUF2270 domain-containing protein [Halococcoides cellulosivorans]AWB26843.1 hypothetical protein HARCEL1_03480 [Halococcoides cellulosivorans]
MSDDRSEKAATGTDLLEEGMGPGSAMAHLYRGEIHRMTVWRERLDRTTNWAVIVVAAVLTWAFSSPDHPHYIILIGMAAVGVFLGIEARRYRGYEIWRSRVRRLQRNLWTLGLDPDREVPEASWRERLAADYSDPAICISMEEAIAHRLRRIYLPLLGLLAAAWVARITAFSDLGTMEAAAIGRLPGWLVVGGVVAVGLGTLAVAFRPRDWRVGGELLHEDLREPDQ